MGKGREDRMSNNIQVQVLQALKCTELAVNARKPNFKAEVKY